MQVGNRHFIRYGKAAIALLGVSFVLLLNAMTAYPKLHEWFHKDAGQPDHECAVTMFVHGKVDSVTADVTIFVPTTPIEATPQVEFHVFTPAIENLPLGRAPPAVSSPQV